MLACGVEAERVWGRFEEFGVAAELLREEGGAVSMVEVLGGPSFPGTLTVS